MSFEKFKSILFQNMRQVAHAKKTLATILRHRAHMRVQCATRA